MTLTQVPGIRFHVSLNISDLGKAIAFYRVLFGVEPAKVRDDYAKFEPNDPPLVVSLEPSPRPVGGPLNHLGLRMTDAKALVAMQMRLEAAGLRTNREEGVECCYAKQTKFWITDPDGTLWEIYTLEGDLNHRGAGQSLEAMVPDGKPAMAAQVVWEHRLGQPVPQRSEHKDHAVDEVRLRGSLNVPLSRSDRLRLMTESRRILRPGGRVFVHVLAAERALEQAPGLHGPAAAVLHTPVEDEPVRLLEEAGFVAVRVVKLDTQPCFVRHGVGLREMQIEAFQATGCERVEPVQVLYAGPFEKIEAGGVVLQRGRRTSVPGPLAAQLRAGQNGVIIFDRPAGTAKHQADCGA